MLTTYGGSVSSGSSSLSSLSSKNNAPPAVRGVVREGRNMAMMAMIVVKDTPLRTITARQL